MNYKLKNKSALKGRFKIKEKNNKVALYAFMCGKRHNLSKKSSQFLRSSRKPKFLANSKVSKKLCKFLLN